MQVSPSELQIQGASGERLTTSPRPALSLPWHVAIVFCVAAAYAVPAIMYALFFPMWGNLPSWDQWHLVPIWDSYYSGGNFWPMMFEPYAGHLNIIPRFVFLGLAIASHWDIRWEITLSFVLATVTLTIFVRALAAAHDRRLLVLALPIAGQVFSALQFENFMSGYPLGQNISQLAATAAVYFATRKQARTQHIFLAGLGAFVATFSWGAGLVAWPVVLVALILRRPLRIGWVVGMVAATFATAVVVHAGYSGRPPIRVAAIAEFFAILLGKPAMLVPFPAPHACVSAGIALLLLSGLCFALAGMARLWQPMFRWAMFALLGVASAALISIGRFEDGPPQALSSHYVTASYPLLVATIVVVAALLLAWAAYSQNLFGRVVALLALAAVAIVMTLQPAVVAARTIPVLRDWSRSSPEFVAKVIAGTVTDDEIHRSTHPDADLVRWSIEALRRHHLALFADPNVPPPTVPAPTLPNPRQAHQAPGLVGNSASLGVGWGTPQVPSEVAAGGEVPVRLVVTNRGDTPWVAFSTSGANRFPVRIGYRWLGASGPDGEYDKDHRADFPDTVKPGEASSVSFVIRAPVVPGNYTLQIGLLQEAVFWFEDRGVAPLRIPVHVKAP